MRALGRAVIEAKKQTHIRFYLCTFEAFFEENI